MKLRYVIVLTLVMILFTSCNSFSPSPQLTSESAWLDETQTPPDKEAAVSTTTTPLEPETPTIQLPASTQTPISPTSTAASVATVTPEGSSQTPTMIPTKKLVLKPSATQALFGPQIGSPIGIPGFVHSDLGCRWMGLAGQVFDIDDTPMVDLVIEVGGTLDQQPVTALAITGQAEAYGLGGYEIKLGDEPIASNGTLWAQVFDLDGNAISSPTYFSTYSECEKNLILLNFVQSFKLPSEWTFLPIISNGSPNP